MSVDPELAERLRSVGVDPATPGDPAVDWARLHARFGVRATLLDRYTLEADARGIAVDDLGEPLRARLTREVIEAHWPGFEPIAGSDRTQADPVEVVAYDPGWPDRYERWRTRLVRELGPVALRMEHVGSTAVPGLPAKPVIDIQVSVPDLVDEAAYAGAIERAGVAFRNRDDEHRYFRPSGNLPRDVQVHVCPAGSEWERRHLLYRDFLRADVATREAYGRLKLELAVHYRDDRIAYNEAKTAFILDALEQAEGWDAAGRPARPGPPARPTEPAETTEPDG